MKIFIAGASGYLGSHLVRAFSINHDVVALLRATSSSARLEGTPVAVFHFDSADSLERAFVKYRPDIVVNAAALYGRNQEPLSVMVDANIGFPSLLLSLANKYNAMAFIHAGTSLPDNISLYARTKNAFVELAYASNELLVKDSEIKLKFINVALEHFYGPGDDTSKFVSYVIDACHRNQDLELTQGLQERDFIYIDDVVSGFEVLVSKLADLEYFETISVGSGVAPSVQDLVRLIHTLSKSDAKLNFGAVPMREGELMHSCADNRRLMALGWTCLHTVSEGIQATLKREYS